jgi:hypothetical protein
MGCDIHSHAERKSDNGEWKKIEGIEPFDWRSYGMFGFLAGVRNYSDVTPISLPRGIPKDASKEVIDDYESLSCDAHSASWIDIDELIAFNYDIPCEDRRVTRQIGANYWNGGCTCAPGGGKQTTYREFLDEGFFEELRKLHDAGVGRIIFWFDN